MLPKAAIIGSTCQLIVSFLPYWLSGNVLAEGLSYVCFADIENDAGPLHFWVQEHNNKYISLFHCLKEKKTLLLDFLPWVKGEINSFAT